jgi:hypothetical protein
MLDKKGGRGRNGQENLSRGKHLGGEEGGERGERIGARRRVK